MQLGNRIFPYPVLNQNSEITEFKEKIKFELKLDLDNNGEIIKRKDKAVFENIHFELNDNNLLELYKEGKIACHLIVESSSSIYREKFTLLNEPQTIEIELAKLKGDVFISAYCYALCNIENYMSENFNEDYDGYVFNIEKYEILAIDDGLKFVIDRNLDEDNKVSSIFVIVRSEANKDTISFDMKREKIHIYLPPKEHDYYNLMKHNPSYNDIFFAMLAIPVLTSCFHELKNTKNNLLQIKEEYEWFNSIVKSYKREKGCELTYDEFDNQTPLDLAQIVFNFSSVKGIDKLYSILSEVKGADGDE